MYIAIDFDGTLVHHEYPKIGEELQGAVETVKSIHENGNFIILYTMRSGAPLVEAVEWCTDRGIKLFAVNENPHQNTWAKDSRKVYAHLYIDDAALGAYLDANPGRRPSINWEKVRAKLIELGIIKNKKPIANMKIKKDSFLFFSKHNRYEKVTKSSNNESDGIIRTYYEKERRSKEYSVAFILANVRDSSISILTEEEVSEKLKLN